jgi:hypothetical protein
VRVKLLHMTARTGLKTEAAVPSRQAWTFDIDSLRRLVKERLSV